MKVNAYVHITGKQGEFVVLKPGDTVPDWATVTNPAVIDSDSVEADAAAEKAAAEAEAGAEAATKPPAKKAAPASE